MSERQANYDSGSEVKSKSKMEEKIEELKYLTDQLDKNIYKLHDRLEVILAVDFEAKAPPDQREKVPDITASLLQKVVTDIGERLGKSNEMIENLTRRIDL